MALSIRARFPLPKTKRHTCAHSHTPTRNNHKDKQHPGTTTTTTTTTTLQQPQQPNTTTNKPTNKHYTQIPVHQPHNGWIHSRNALLYFFYGSADVKPNSHHFSALCRWLVVYTYPPGGDSLPNNPDLYQANSNACSTALHSKANYILTILFTISNPHWDCFLTRFRDDPLIFCTSDSVFPKLFSKFCYSSH